MAKINFIDSLDDKIVPILGQRSRVKTILAGIRVEFNCLGQTALETLVHTHGFCWGHCYTIDLETHAIMDRKKRDIRRALLLEIKILARQGVDSLESLAKLIDTLHAQHATLLHLVDELGQHSNKARSGAFIKSFKAYLESLLPDRRAKQPLEAISALSATCAELERLAIRIHDDALASSDTEDRLEGLLEADILFGSGGQKLYALRGEIDHAGKLLRADMQCLLHGLLADLTWQPALPP